MPPKSKNDPFNFDAEFAKIGAGGLVKTTMGEMKKASAASTTAGAAASRTVPSTGHYASGATTSSRPAPTSTSSAGMSNGMHANAGTPPTRSSVQLPAGSLDFLDGLAAGAPKAPPKAAPAPSASTKPARHDDFFHDFGTPSPARPAPPAPATAPTVSASGSADPFAMFDDVPGAQPVQPATISPADDGFAAFDDEPAPFFQSAAQAPPSAPQTASSTDSSTHKPQPPAAAPPAQSQPVRAEAAPPLPVSQAARQPGSPGAMMARTQASPAAGPIPSGPALGRHSASGDSHTTRSPALPRPRSPPMEQSEWGGGRHGSSTSSYSSPQAYSSSAPVEPKAAVGVGGMMNMLKGLGKKAVKAAQAGLQQLETALERMEGSGPAGSNASGYSPSDAPSHMYDRPGSHAGRPGANMTAWGDVHTGGGRDSGDDEPPRHQDKGQEEDPSALALTILALPPGERSRALSMLQPRVRPRVQQILEQLTEGEAPPASLSVDIKTSAVDLASFGSPPSGGQQAAARTHQAVSPARPARAPVSPTFDEPPPEFSSFQQAPAAPTPTPPAAAAAAAPQPVSATPAPAAEQHDLLGMSPRAYAAQAAGAGFAASTAGSQPGAAAGLQDDLLGFNNHASSSKPPQPPAPAVTKRASPAVVDVDDVHDDFFSGGGAAPAVSTQRSSSSGVAAASHRAASAPHMRPAPTAAAAAAAPLMDLHAVFGDDSNVDTSSYGDLYKHEQGEEGEPELRRQLRANRIAEKHARMRSALEGKLAAEAEEARAREQQVVLKEELKAIVDTWKNKSKGNIRGLLGSLQNVLWEGSGWQPVGMGDLLEPGQIRKAWMKANLLVHPDKVRQRNGTPEQVARADMIFDVLKDAWNTFQTTGR